MNDSAPMSQHEKTFLQEMLAKNFWKIIFLRSLPIFVSQFVMEYLAYFSYLYNFKAFSYEFAFSIMPIKAIIYIASSLQMGVIRYYCVKILIPCIEQDEQKAAYEHTVFTLVNAAATVFVMLCLLPWAHVFIKMYHISNSYIPYYIIQVLCAYTFSQCFVQMTLVFAIERRRFLTMIRGIALVVIQSAIEGSLYVAMNFNVEGKSKTNWPTYTAYLASFAIAVAYTWTLVKATPFFGYVNHRVIVAKKVSLAELKALLRYKSFWKSMGEYAFSGFSYMLCNSTSGCVVLIGLSQIYSLSISTEEYLPIIFRIFVAYITQFIYYSSATATISIHLESTNILYRNKYYRRANKFTFQCIIVTILFCVFPILLNMFYPPILTFLPKDALFEAMITDEIKKLATVRLIIYTTRYLYELVINFALSLGQNYVLIIFSFLKFVSTLLPLLTAFPQNLESTDYVYVLTQVETGYAVMMLILLIGYFVKLHFCYYDDVDRIKKEAKKKKKKQSIERKRKTPKK